ncbi:MAG: hypothetical protein NTV57_08285, partial [Cyanobacteria bacterium]|nr:hypothetical protein [Cyanobacteriota bacterium]
MSHPLILDGDAIEGAAQDPVAIGKLMVDQVWAEGGDPTGGGLYYERNSNQHRRLQAFETGSEDLMTGGWVRVLASAEQVRKERPGMEQAAREGLVTIHGSHRGRPAGGVPRRCLGLSRRRKAPVGSSRPSACHGCAVACIG